MKDITDTLKYLGGRLSLFGGDELKAAKDLVDLALSMNPGLIQGESEHALFNSVWGHVSRALDHQDFDLSYADAVSALEAEMAGRVMIYRMQRGWVVRGESAPTTFPSFRDLVVTKLVTL